jgi:hypothetical protein
LARQSTTAATPNVAALGVGIIGKGDWADVMIEVDALHCFGVIPAGMYRELQEAEFGNVGIQNRVDVSVGKLTRKRDNQPTSDVM